MRRLEQKEWLGFYLPCLKDADKAVEISVDLNIPVKYHGNFIFIPTKKSTGFLKGLRDAGVDVQTKEVEDIPPEEMTTTEIPSLKELVESLEEECQCDKCRPERR